MSDTPGSGGFTLQLETGTDPEAAQIRLLLNGLEVARGPAIECAEQSCVGDCPEPWTRTRRPYDVFPEEVDWIEEKLGVVISRPVVEEEETEA